jgi:hypothetical protein
MSMKKKLALGAAGGLAALIAGRELYKRKDQIKGSAAAGGAKASGFFAALRARFGKKSPEEKKESAPVADYGPSV